MAHQRQQSLLWSIWALLLLSITNSADAKKPCPNPGLEAIREKHHLPGLAAARVKFGRHDKITSRAVGVRKFGSEPKLTTEDTFHLGSLSKAMTSTLAAILIEDPGNSLTWNTTVAEALPHVDMIAAHKDTTLAMLGANYGGLNDTSLFIANLDMWDDLTNDLYTTVEARRIVAERAFAAEPDVTPGESFLYSNIGYMILGHVVDTHAPSGSWDSAIFEQLWEPLGMTGCGLGFIPQSDPELIIDTWPHMPGDPDPIPVPWNTDNPPALGPASTAHCDIESYAKFLSLHYNGHKGRETKILPAEAFEILHTPYEEWVGRVPIGEDKNGYAPGGWNVDEHPGAGGRYLYHEGSNELNHVWSVVAPAVNQGLFVGTNVGGAKEAMEEVTEGLLSGTLGF